MNGSTSAAETDDGFAGMPLSAAATGVADFTGAPHELAALLTGGLPPPSGRAARIVLVEDQLDAREMMRACLTR